jgi:cyclic pyranopterin phosphate synthase
MYCAPQADFSLFPHEEILTFEEIVSLCQAFAVAGTKKIRLTGGEPLVRRDIIRLAESIAGIDGIEELCLTTNGTRLLEYAAELYEIGVRHVNVSLDTLNREKFVRITGKDEFDKVWRGLLLLADKGFSPIKVNFVVMKGVNDDELADAAALDREYPFDIRFIEFMQVGKGSAWTPSSFMTSTEVRQVVEEKFEEKLLPCNNDDRSGPATMFMFEGWTGRIGFISPLSDHFCDTCNRIRMTPDGKLRLCLFSDKEIDVKVLVRNGAGRDELVSFIRSAVLAKPENYNEAGGRVPSCNRCMSRIGG